MSWPVGRVLCQGVSDLGGYTRRMICGELGFVLCDPELTRVTFERTKDAKV